MAHKEWEAIQACCSDCQVQIVDQRGASRQGCRVVMPHQGHRERTTRSVHAVLVGTAGREIGHVHDLQRPAWP